MVKSIRWRLSIPFVFLVLILMSVLFIYVSGFVRDVQIENEREQLRTGAQLIGEAVAELHEGARHGERLPEMGVGVRRLLTRAQQKGVDDAVGYTHFNFDACHISSSSYKSLLQS